MFKRTPTTKDGKPVDMFDGERVLSKPFRTPTMLKQRELPQRKRKKVSYKGAQGGGSDEDSEEENNGKRKKQKSGRDGYEASTLR